MNIVRLAMRLSPDETKTLLRQILDNDKRVNELMYKLVSS